MKIAELFVDLGVKGEGKLDKTLKSTKGSMGELLSSSLALKAALVGIAYAMQNMMGDSAKTGQGLENFTALTGMSAQKLQQWQYAARQVGLSNEEMAGSFKAVQNSVTNMLLGKGAPEGYAMIANKVGLDQDKLRDTEYMMKKLQEFAQQVPPDVGNQMIKSFGVSEGTIAAMRRNAFRPEIMKNAPTYSDKETAQLSKVDAAWSNLGNKIQMAMGHFTAKDGLKLVNDLSKITTEVIKMVNAFAKLADQLKLMKGIGMVFEGWGMIFKSLTAAIDTVSQWAGSDEKVQNFGSGVKNFAVGVGEAAKGAALTLQDSMKPVAPANSVGNKNQTVNINQNLNFQHSGKDAQKTGESVNKAARDAIRTSQSQAQVN